MDWRKSSYSMGNGNCVEWRASSYSNGKECIEVAPAVQVRDSKDPAGPRLQFAPQAWRDFTRRITLPAAPPPAEPSSPAAPAGAAPVP